MGAILHPCEYLNMHQVHSETVLIAQLEAIHRYACSRLSKCPGREQVKMVLIVWYSHPFTLLYFSPCVSIL